MDDFVIPEAGSPEMIDLLCRLEQARYELANAWSVVVADDETGEVCHTYGPFDEAEQALAHAGEHDRDWHEQEGDEAGSWKYAIVPLWGPGE